MCILEIVILILSILISGYLDYLICNNSNIYFIFLGIIFIPLFYVLIYALWLFIIFIHGLFLKTNKDIKHFNKYYYWIVKESNIFFLHLIRVKCKKIDFDKIPKDKKYLLVCNHVSNFDQMVLIECLRKKNEEMAWISKPENMNFPIAGPMIHHTGFIPINRENPLESIIAFRKAINYLNNNECNIGVCPEGTRNKTSDKILLDFHPVVFDIAKRSRVPIVVVGLKNTKKISKNAPFKKTIVEIKVLNVLEFNKEDDAKTISFNVYNELYEYLKEN